MKKVLRTNLCIVGEESCGKTCLVKTLCEGRFDPVYNQTVGIDYGMRYETVDGKSIQLNIFDFSGSETFSTIVDEYLPLAQIVFICYTCGKFDAKSIEEYEKRLQSLSAKPFVKMLVGCKRDVAKNEKDLIGKFCQEAQATYCSVSAKDPVSVRNLFKQALELLLQRMGQASKK